MVLFKHYLLNMQFQIKYRVNMYTCMFQFLIGRICELKNTYCFHLFKFHDIFKVLNTIFSQYE